MNEFSLDACLARIERWQPRINAFVHVDRNPAKAQTGPLSGLPLAHKDMFFRSGKVSNCGSKIRRDWVRDVYHKPNDDAKQTVDVESAARFNHVILGLLQRVANDRARPRWNDDSFFKRFAK